LYVTLDTIELLIGRVKGPKTHTYTKYMSLCVWVCVSVRVCVLNKYHNAI